MITGPNGTITLDPERLIPAGDHRYRITRDDLVLGQTWTCERCGDVRRPTEPHVPCAAGPVAA